MGTKKEVLEYLHKEWQMKISDLLTLSHEIHEREQNRKALLEHLKKLLSFFETLNAKPPTAIPPELQAKQETGLSIGDTMEAILRTNGGSMLKTDVMGVLKLAGKLTGKNARIIFKNAIKRDAKKRFRSEGGKVLLAETGAFRVTGGEAKLVVTRKKEKADAKS